MSEENTTKDLPELSKDAREILEKVKTLSVLDLANLVKHMEEEFGVSAAAPVAAVTAAPAGGGGDAGGDAAAEKSEFDVVLKSPGAAKINVIKVVKEITGLGLGEAKALVDGAPKPVKEKVKKEEAEEIANKLKEAGAEVELA